jgi:hypothetical protein
MFATVYSVNYHLPSISGDHLLQRNLRLGHNVMTRKLMIHWNYNNSFYHRLVFLVALTVLLKKFTPQPDITSLINVLLSLSIIELLLIFILLLTSFWHSVSIWLLTDILAWQNKIYNAQTGREVHTKLQELSQQPFVSKLLNFSAFLKKTGAIVLRKILCSGGSQFSNSGKFAGFLSSPKLADWLWDHTASWLLCTLRRHRG